MNYRAKLDDEWEEVIRYDTHHGRLHIHRFWRAKDQQIEYLEKQAGEIEDYTSTFENAKTDVTENWPRYRRFIEESSAR